MEFILQDEGGTFQVEGTWISVIISLCDVHTNLIASGVPIPAPLGSPHGPNQWFYGAPVVLARIPVYVTPLTVFEAILLRNLTSFETTAAVRWFSIRFKCESTVSTYASV